ncbi:hypothetical protein SAMN04488514_1373, partial [Kriegella aquimaris]
LGHTKLSTTQIYARVVEKKVGEDMQNLMAKMKQKNYRGGGQLLGKAMITN